MNSRFVHLLLVGFVASLFLLNKAESFPDVCKGCWYEVPNSNLADVYKTPNPGPWSDQGGIMGAYSGAAYDLRRNRLIIAGGGGWGQYAGNEVYAFDVDSLKWTRILNGASVFDEADTVTPFYYNGGAVPDSQQPRPGFTFDAIEYDSTTDKVYLFGIIKSYSHGNTFSDINALDLNTLLWSHSGNVSTDNSFGGPVSAKDPLTGKIWFFANGYYPVLTSFYPPNNQYVDHGHPWMVSPGLPAFQTAAIMPSTQRLISVGGDAIRYWDISDTTVPMLDDSLPATNCDSLAHAAGPGLQWSPVHRKLIAWTGGNHVITLDSTYACEDIAPADSNTVTPDAPSNAGTYGRWQYIPKYDVFLLVNSTTGNVYFYRLSDSSDTDTTAPPVVQITSPANGSYFNSSPITLSWMVDSVTQTTQLTEALVEGMNQVIRADTNAHGIGADTIIVYLDTHDPVVEIFSPEDSVTVSSSPILLRYKIDGGPAQTMLKTLSSGWNILTVTVMDAAGNIGQDTVHVNLASTSGAPTWPGGSSLTLDSITSTSMALHWTSATDDSGVAFYRIFKNGYPVKTLLASIRDFKVSGLLMNTHYTFWIQALDLRGNMSTGGPHAEATTLNVLPDDPVSLAPPLPVGAPTSFANSVAFLYQGTDAIQDGVTLDSLNPVRLVVAKGRVLSLAGSPLSGVTVTILNHPEWGSTVTRENGEYDLVFNGGGALNIVFLSPNHLMAQRQIKPLWQEFLNVPDVYLISQDTVVTAIGLTSGDSMQVAQASVVTDSSGSRQATLIIPAATSTDMVLEDGSTRPLNEMHIRMTEYTIGSHGEEAMPATLPPTSGYTYAIDFSVDEEKDWNSSGIVFNDPLWSYVENFVNIPVGYPVPSAYFDKKKGQWIPTQDGRVIQIASITSGMANLIVDTTGLTASSGRLDSLGFTNDERTRLANLYSVNQTLWRVPIRHFTVYDYNYPVNLPNGASAPPATPGPGNSNPKCADATGGSIINCQNQSFGEWIEFPNMPTLHYQSERVPAPRWNTIRFQISDSAFPSSVAQIFVQFSVAGRKFITQYSPAPNLTGEFEWDGLDAYGREVHGKQPYRYSVLYGYEVDYQVPAFPSGLIPSGVSFGLTNGKAFPGSVPARSVYYLSNTFTGYFGSNEINDIGPGWSLSGHHVYEPMTGNLYKGNGQTEQVITGKGAIYHLAGNSSGSTSNEAPAKSSRLVSVNGMDIGADGSLYLAERGNSDICKIDKSGLLTRFAQGHSWFDVKAASDGTLYLTAYSENRIYKLTPIGVLSIFAGNGSGGYGGDEGLAVNATLNNPNGTAVGIDGSVFIADRGNHRVRQVTPDGIIHTVAGNGTYTYNGEGLSGPEAQVNANFIAVGPDGSLYIGESANCRIRRMDASGRVYTVAGNGTSGTLGDGGPAIEAQVCPDRIAVVATKKGGTAIFTSDELNNTIRVIDENGIINRMAGGGSNSGTEGIMATFANIEEPRGIAADVTGNLYIATFQGADSKVMVVRNALPDFDNKNILLPSGDSREIYVMNPEGRHLETRNALTGSTILSFAYDTSGRLMSMTDAYGNTTTITRTSDGNPTHITNAYGVGLDFITESNGNLTAVVMPNGDDYHYTYASGTHWMDTYTTPRGNTYTFSYTTDGKLLVDADPEGGSKTLARMENDKGWLSTVTTVMGRQNKYALTYADNLDLIKENTDPAGLQTVTTIGASGLVTSVQPDSTTTTSQLGPEPLLKMQGRRPLLTTTSFPLGYPTMQREENSLMFFTDEDDPMSLREFNQYVEINSRLYLTIFERSTLSFTSRSPEWRMDSIVIDTLGRTIERHKPGLATTYFRYDNHGRVDTVIQGSGGSARKTRFAYNASGHLQSIVDAEGHTTQYTYDLAGRVTEQEFPNGQTMSLAYNADGGIDSIIPPGRSAHRFSTTGVGLENNYEPPSLGAGAWNTSTSYNLDRQMLSTQTPDSAEIEYDYDSTGRVTQITIPTGVYAFAYHPTTGQLDSITSPYGVTLRYTYNGSLPVKEAWSGGMDGAVHFYFDNNLQLGDVLADPPNGLGTFYVRDDDGLITDNSGLAIDRDPGNGRVIQTTFELVRDTIEYNEFGEVSEYEAYVSGSSIFHCVYSRDKLGRLTGKTETVEGVTHHYDYNYDLAGRLDTVRIDSVISSVYTYDANGNRLTHTTSGGTDSAVYDGQDRLLAYGGNTYTYSRHGRLKTRTTGSGTDSLAYDALGNLLNVRLSGGSRIDYLVDPRNRRVGCRVDSAFAGSYVFRDALRPLAKLDSTGQVTSVYNYGLRENIPDWIYQGDSLYRVISDHLGSPRLVIDALSGAVVQRMRFDEFGVVLQDDNSGFQPFGFAGGLYDTATGLVRFGARDYDATVGRWTAKDPIGFDGGSNYYMYTGNNPVTYIDPSGLLDFDPVFFAGGSGGYAAGVGDLAGAGIFITSSGNGTYSYSGTQYGLAFGAGGEIGFSTSPGAFNGGADFASCMNVTISWNSSGVGVSVSWGPNGLSEFGFSGGETSTTMNWTQPYGNHKPRSWSSSQPDATTTTNRR